MRRTWVVAMLCLAAGPSWAVDSDGDGFEAAIDGGLDCDDGDPSAYPDAEEFCDGVDNDCDGLVDEPSAFDARVWFLDADGDGFGDDEATIEDCAQLEGYVRVGGDCDDEFDFVAPDQDEICDGVDNNCNLRIDEPELAIDVQNWYADADGDGYGSVNDIVLGCGPPPGDWAPGDWVPAGSLFDCDDADPTCGPCTAPNHAPRACAGGARGRAGSTR